jgi:hypothetical protein
MIILGLLLLLIGWFLGIALLWLIGVVLLIGGAVLLVAAHLGHGVGGRHWW